MENLQVVINHYGDPDMLDDALASVADVLPETPVVVADGRYANHAGPTDLTPETPAICAGYENVTYHSPPEERLPFGEENAYGRFPIHQKATWLWYEVADPETWALKLDADELLREFALDEDALAALDREKKYLVNLNMAENHVENARLWVPDRWTFYVDDLCMPREEVPRTTDYEGLRDRCRPEFTWTRVESRREQVRIENRGYERSEDYMESRRAVKNEISDEAG